MRLKQIIASSCRQKIVLALAETKGTHITNLTRIVNSTYNQVSRNVEILEKEGIVKTKRLGYLRMVELQMENPRTVALLRALHTLNGPDTNTQRSIA